MHLSSLIREVARLTTAPQIFVALHTLEDFDEDIASWDDVDQSDLTHADRLTIVSEQLVVLKRMAAAAAPSSTPLSQVLATAHFALAVDRQLLAWFEACPPDWRPAPAVNATPARLKAWGAWRTRVDVLPDIFVSSLLNQARGYRVSAQTIIAQCLEHASTPFARVAMSTHPSQTVQMLVDDICATVPFAVGDRYCESQRDMDIVYPHAHGVPTPTEHKESAYKSGGWFLVRISTCCDVCACVCV